MPIPSMRLLSLLLGSSPKPPLLKTCDRYANVELVNQFGERSFFHDRYVADGRALVLNTMYTRCRGTCPGTSQTIETLRRELTPIFGQSLSFVSLSIDPLEDTPSRLAQYARFYHADRPRPEWSEWHFLTGSLDSVDRLRRSLGFFDLDPRVDQDVTQHASTLLFGNSSTDRWSAIPAELPFNQLLTTIRRVAGFTFEQKYGIPS